MNFFRYSSSEDNWIERLSRYDKDWLVEKIFVVVVMLFGFFAAFCATSIVSIVFIHIFFQSYRPKTILREPIFIDYSKVNPVANISLWSVENQWRYVSNRQPSSYSDQRFRPESKYTLLVDFEIPYSSRNMERGHFMSKLSIVDSSYEVIAFSSRPVVLPFKSTFTRIVDSVLYYPLYALGYSFWNDATIVTVNYMNEYQESKSSYPFTRFVELSLETADVDINKVELSILPSLSGLAYFFYFYPVSSYILGYMICMTVLWSIITSSGIIILGAYYTIGNADSDLDTFRTDNPPPIDNPVRMRDNMDSSTSSDFNALRTHTMINASTSSYSQSSLTPSQTIATPSVLDHNTLNSSKKRPVSLPSSAKMSSRARVLPSSARLSRSGGRGSRVASGDHTSASDFRTIPLDFEASSNPITDIDRLHVDGSGSGSGSGSDVNSDDFNDVDSHNNRIGSPGEKDIIIDNSINCQDEMQEEVEESVVGVEEQVSVNSRSPRSSKVSRLRSPPHYDYVEFQPEDMDLSSQDYSENYRQEENKDRNEKKEEDPMGEYDERSSSSSGTSMTDDRANQDEHQSPDYQWESFLQLSTPSSIRKRK